MPSKIAYLMSRFPLLSETFILREMIELTKSGWDVALYPLIRERPKVVHAEAHEWEERAHHTSWFSAAVISANLVAFINSPVLYFSLFWRVVWGNRSSLKFLMRALILFPKSVCIARWMKRDGIQHIHAHFATHPALSAWIIHKLTGISYSVTVHAHDIFVDRSMLEPKLCAASAVVAISEFNKKYLIDHLGDWVCDKIHVIHCGIELENYGNRKRKRDHSFFEILSTGSLQPYKGQSFLVEACQQLRDRNILFHCTIIGGGELHSQLLEQISDLKLTDFVKLTGPKTQQEVMHYLTGVDCYIQPSVITKTGQMEGIPVALMEAMASGLPVIATNLSGVPELVRDGETGWLVPPGNSVALVDAVLSVYQDPLESDRRARAGRNLVQKEFHLQTNVRELSSLFENLIEAQRK